MEKNSRTIRVISRSGFVVYAALAPVYRKLTDGIW